jgi:transcriptional regulator with XRE-family HTH domain
MPNMMSPLVTRLRALREERGWSQLRLADEAGVRQATISLLESGKVRRLDTDVLDRLAAALRVTPLELLANERPSSKRRRRG